jgi:hypothetical protein
MAAARHLAWAIVLLLALAARASAEQVVLKDLSLDKPLILDSNVDYLLRNVTVTGLVDAAAVTLTGRINSVTIEKSTFGRVWTGMDNKAAGLECAGAMVGRLTATDTTFFDAENQLTTLKEGSFGKVTFERCRFATSTSFLKSLYEKHTWRTTPPVTEFYNIERLELLDNEYSNTVVVIHPSVKQVVLRGNLPGLQIENPQTTQVIHLDPGQLAETIALPQDAVLAAAD